MKDLQLRKALIGDEKKIVDISLKTWETTYGEFFSKNFFEKRRAKKNDSINWWKGHLSTHNNVYVALFDSNIVGFMDFYEESRTIKDCTEIGSIYILKDYQNQGIGRAFLTIAYDLTKEIGKNKLMLNVLKLNPAVKFYERMGGHQIGSFQIEIDGKKLDEAIILFDL